MLLAVQLCQQAVNPCGFELRGLDGRTGSLQRQVLTQAVASAVLDMHASPAGPKPLHKHLTRAGRSVDDQFAPGNKGAPDVALMQLLQMHRQLADKGGRSVRHERHLAHGSDRHRKRATIVVQGNRLRGFLFGRQSGFPAQSRPGSPRRRSQRRLVARDEHLPSAVRGEGDHADPAGSRPQQDYDRQETHPARAETRTRNAKTSVRTVESSGRHGTLPGPWRHRRGGAWWVGQDALGRC